MKLELEAVKRLVPKGHRTLITQQFLDRIEAAAGDGLIAEQIKENFITYANVLSSGKYKMEDYINAVKYVSHKLLGRSNKDAYAATFPERYQRLVSNGKSEDIDAFCSMYNKNKLVMAIYEQTVVPTHVLNAPLHQEALSELAKMIRDPGTKGLVKVKACEAILAYTKPPDIIDHKLTIGVEQQETIADLRAVTEELADMFRMTVEKGHRSLKEIAEANIIDVESEVVYG